GGQAAGGERASGTPVGGPPPTGPLRNGPTLDFPEGAAPELALVCSHLGAGEGAGRTGVGWPRGDSGSGNGHRRGRRYLRRGAGGKRKESGEAPPRAVRCFKLGKRLPRIFRTYGDDPLPI